MNNSILTCKTINIYILPVEFQLVKAIILDTNNLYPGNGNRQAVLTFNHSQDMNS